MDRGDVRVGVVGLGKMGLVHTGVLSVLPGVQVAGLCEKSGFLRRYLGKVFDAPVVRDVTALAEFELDAVFVTTPIPTHYAVIKSIYAENIAKNVFVEKPLAGCYEEAAALCGLARSVGRVNMVGYLRRLGVTFLKARDLLDEGVLGNVSSVAGYAYSSDFLEGGSQRESDRGGMMRDLGCHVIDLALWYLGDLHVESAESIAPNSENAPVNFTANGSNGLEATFAVSWRQPGYRMAEVGFTFHGQRGVLEVTDDRVRLQMASGESATWHRHDLADHVPFWLGLPEYYREDLRFITSVRQGVEAQPCFRTASKVDKIIEEVA